MVTLLIITIILICTGVYFISKSRDYSRVCFKEKCFSVEIAKTYEQGSRGLMFRDKLDSGSGMLFIFPDDRIQGFWMKDTLIPLDIIWINSSREVVYIAQNVQPCKETCETIEPSAEARYALEINAGLSEEFGLKVGDEARLDY